MDMEETEKVNIEVGDEYEVEGERVEITNKKGETFCLLYKDRDPYDDSNSHTVWRPRYTLESIIKNEGWEKIEEEDNGEVKVDYEWSETPRCPLCKRFMSQGDADGAPEAQCSREGCDGFLDMHHLQELGYIN